MPVVHGRLQKAELIDYSSIKGMFYLPPVRLRHLGKYPASDGCGIQKKTGAENVYMPMLIPESLLQKEKDHVEGFAPGARGSLGGSDSRRSATVSAHV